MSSFDERLKMIESHPNSNSICERQPVERLRRLSLMPASAITFYGQRRVDFSSVRPNCHFPFSLRLWGQPVGRPRRHQSREPKSRPGHSDPTGRAGYGTT